MSTTKEQFLAGFAQGLGIDDINTASVYWDAFSRNLSDVGREAEEAAGFDRGMELGAECRSLDADTAPRESFTITGPLLTLVESTARVARTTIPEVLANWLEGAFEAEVEDAWERRDSEAVLWAAEADHNLILEVVTPPELQGRSVALEDAKKLLTEEPGTILRARYNYPRTAKGAA